VASSSENWSNLDAVLARIRDNDDYTELATQIGRQPCVRKVLRRFFRQYQDRDDALQEILLQVYRSIKSNSAPTDPTHFGGWLCRVAKNSAIDHYRRYRKHVGLDDVHVVVPGTSARQDEEVGRKESQILLRECIDALGEPCRKVFLLRLSGFSYEEIARRLGITETIVNNCLHRQRQQLKQCIEEHTVMPPPRKNLRPQASSSRSDEGSVR
jgi:RNA polymerase sigma factor (sigma-70 family)